MFSLKKDIEIPVVKHVHVAVVYEWNKDFLAREWNAYLINNRKTAIEMTIVVSKGYNGDIKTSVMRHGLGTIAGKSFVKIELLQEEVLALNNEFYLTFFADNKLYEKRFVFPKNTIFEKACSSLPVMESEGILCPE